MAGLATTYNDPVHIAVIGGTGLQTLPHFTAVASLTPTTPWGAPSSPITILHHPSPTSPSTPVPIAFLSRHGPHHQLAPHEVPSRANIAALRSLGVRCIIAFSAVGSLLEAIKPRDFVVPDQIIDRTKGVRPFTFFESGLVAHVPFAEPFDESLAQVVRSCGHALEGEGVRLHDRGTLVCMEGPQFSTKAESRLYRAWGGAVINMSALPEAKLAREAEIAYQMICMSTDYDCWRAGDGTDDGNGGSDANGGEGGSGGEGGGESVTVELVMANMRANSGNARAFVGAVLDELSKDEHEGLVKGRHLEGMSRRGVSTAKEGVGREARERWEWLFPGGGGGVG